MNKNKQYNKRSPKPDLKFNVESECALLEFLREKFKNKAGNKVKAMLTHKQVSVNDVVRTQYDYPLKPGQVVTVSHYDPRAPHKSDLLSIIYEDDELIAIDKPAGLLTISTDKGEDLTAYHLVREYITMKNPKDRIFVVHRLDRDTSGVVIFAKNENIKRLLQDNWGEIVKYRGYMAVVQGIVTPKSGRIESYLLETKTHLMYSSQTVGDGLRAITNYKVLKENGNYSMLEIWLDTGRKNQIRVHMKDIGHSIVGDKKYGSDENPMKRLALHAYKLELTHPVTNEALSFETPPQNRLTGFMTIKR